MKKYLIATFVAGTLLTTSALAYGEKSSQKGMNANQDQCSQMSIKQCKKMAKHSFKRGKHTKHVSFMKALRGVELTSEQQKKIQDIRVENQKETLKLSSFFSDKGFDAIGYEKQIKEQREKSVQKRALMIEKVYALLTPQQKEKVVAYLKYHE